MITVITSPHHVTAIRVGEMIAPWPVVVGIGGVSLLILLLLFWRKF